MVILRPRQISFFKGNVLKFWITLVLVRFELEKRKPVKYEYALHYGTRNENSIEVYDFSTLTFTTKDPKYSSKTIVFTKAVQNASFKGVISVVRCTVRGFPNRFDRSWEQPPCRSTGWISRMSRANISRTIKNDKGVSVREKCTPRCHANADQLQRCRKIRCTFDRKLTATVRWTEKCVWRNSFNLWNVRWVKKNLRQTNGVCV